ncbi:preprotein translocase subunit SecA [Candidatus Berkelbacteria bacterium]|nr:preprotein translocase subunit SecA [Candidatus Berkelbacteria bacterium]
MMGFLDKFFGDNTQKELGKLKPLTAKINALEPDFERLTSQELKEKTSQFRERFSQGETLDDLLPEAFAAVREAAKRTINQRHFDVQLMGGIILHQGKITEMKTGEGKTLVATLPLYLNALSGKGCHLVTVNDYLARRDADWMGAIYDYLGLKVAAIGHDMSLLYSKQTDEENPMLDVKNLVPITRREAYQADITYGTNNEFGFDYLRDNMVYDFSQMSQRGHFFGIIDEVDSILIDEARTPLIISAPAEESAALYQKFAALVPNLQPEKDYQVDEKMRSVILTDAGMKKMEGLLGLANIYDPKHIELVHHLEEALKAKVLFKKDRDYVVKEGEIVIVDEFTGRMLPGRRYSEGLHQAIEAKEGVEIKRESDTLATISFQNYFRLYEKLSGMTGTAATEKEEFYKIYGLDVVSIPTHKPMIRRDLPDKIYKTEAAKFQAIVAEIKERSGKGQPILVGTISIEKNEHLSGILKKAGVKHEILNAKNHEREAHIIAQAGRKGAVTVATNMAGRGVDIVLGGNPPDANEAKEVKNLGGLHVLGTERHEARRIDNQLRGRSGRQGDPGSSMFYVSLEDDLMRVFGGERLKNLMTTLKMPEDFPIEHSLVSRSIESAQKRVEGHNFDTRKHLVEYDDVMNKHRVHIYKKRRAVLENGALKEGVLELFNEEGKKVFKEKEERLGSEVWANVIKIVYLRVIDSNFVRHLNSMEVLREGIGLRGYGQHDPLTEYKHEAYNLFQYLETSINQELVDILLHLEPAAGTTPRPPQDFGQQTTVPLASVKEASTSSAQPTGGVAVTVRQKGNVLEQTPGSIYPKTGRNQPCPCGATKPDGQPLKYKHCHGR